VYDIAFAVLDITGRTQAFEPFMKGCNGSNSDYDAP
jgi:hypothetical protein